MRLFGRSARARLLAGASAAVILVSAGAVHAEDRTPINIAPQPLATALYQFGGQTGLQVMFAPSLANSKRTAGVTGQTDERLAMAQLLEGTGLTFRREGDIFVIMDASDPQSGSAAEDGADGTVAALVVTAQKREEQIQDVPIAISAFTEKSLQEQKIEGGFDLLKAIPNVTFSKNNFTSYNFSIRGIGTKAVSATTDPGVSVSFNNAGLIQNRLFEQEYFDVERVEVLRGPQGTLYGRNATAGVINVISAKPNLQEFSGWVKGEVGNYHSKRISAMVNIPLVEDRLAIRFAGALTNRFGYDYNATTHHAVNGRDLWSGRVTIAFNPTDRLRTSLLWERFNEDDNRSRTGKQLCKRDPGPTTIGNTPVYSTPAGIAILSGIAYSQGCLPVSLYDKSAFETPNGLALPFVSAGIELGTDLGIGQAALFNLGYLPGGTDGYTAMSLIKPIDPYGGMNQSSDLRVINSILDPVYRAKADVIQFDASYSLTDSLTAHGQTTYDKDSVYSFQDYNRFNTVPIFNNTSNYLDAPSPFSGPSPYQRLAPGGIYCDPQIGCSNSIAGFDISSAKSTQFIQELRIQSDFKGPFNFSAGANYTGFNVLVDYYVMFNLITALSQMPPFNNQADYTKCGISEFATTILLPLDPPVESGDYHSSCPYIDPNPAESINGEGHNYFRSKNPYKLQSAAVFGEGYWELPGAVKITAGLRYTDDRKTFTPIPSQLLLSRWVLGGGDLNRGFVEKPPIKQHWGEFTGRLGVDWKPDVDFTDQTMLYAFYSRGYKGGGANPPEIGYTKLTIAERLGLPPGIRDLFDQPFLHPIAQNTTPTFKPEFVNAFEVGAKNTLFGGGLTANADAFFYDYKDYQVSKIVDRTAVNENFDARVWGLEFETVFAPSRNLRFIGNLGYLDTAIGKGAKSIDLMNRTQSHADWMVVKPWIQFPSNCIAPVAIVERYIADFRPDASYILCGSGGLGVFFGQVPPIDPNTGEIYTPSAYPEVNGGAGFAQDLHGHELPNSPHWTTNLGAEYSFEFTQGWKATIRGDGYWQSQSWARVYNAVNDKLHGWYNANLSLWVENDDGLKIELYAKNILDKTPITDAFINSDDSALTTNVFVLDPRLIGLSIKKDF